MLTYIYWSINLLNLYRQESLEKTLKLQYKAAFFCVAFQMSDRVSINDDTCA